MRHLSAAPLHALAFSSDAGFVADIVEVCEERGIVASGLDALSALPNALGLESFRSAVLLIDAGDSLPDALRTARTLEMLHPGLAIVIATDAPRMRSENGFRLVDRWRTAERVVDEMELAYIGIPAFVSDPLRVLSMLETVHAS